MSKIFKFFLSFILFILLSIGAFFGWQYYKYKKDQDPYKTFLAPRLEFADVEVTSFTAEKTEIQLKLLVKNQLPLDFTADSLDYSIFIKDSKIINDKYRKTIKLKKNDSSWIYLPLTIFNKKLEKVLDSSDQKGLDSVEYKLKASFYTNLVGHRKFDITITKLLPLLYIPEIELQKFKIDSINFKRAIILLDVSVKNRNNFEIALKDINYKVAIENNEWILGKLSGITQIKRQNTTDLHIPIRLSLKEVGKTIGDLISEGKNVNYRLNLKFKVVSDNNMVKDAKVVVESNGSIKSIIDAMNEE